VPLRVLIGVAIGLAVLAAGLTLAGHDGDGEVAPPAILAAIVGCTTAFFGMLAASRVAVALAGAALVVNIAVIVYWIVVIVDALQGAR
jgi:hypothetical protein